MKKLLFVLAVSLALISCKKEIEPYYPFPKNTDYPAPYIKPSENTSVVNNYVREQYDYWKKHFVKKCDNSDETTYYIDYNGKGWTVSEAIGYGMMITAYMAGYDPDAKEIFDGLLAFYRSHLSSINNNLMAWQQIENCQTNPDGGNNSASDGDIDIAYALLLADKQWNSNGDYDYAFLATNIINAIMKDEINHETYSVKLGDWANASDSYYYGTRSSDFIIDHFRVFYRYTTDVRWTNVVEQCETIIDSIQTNYSGQTGLLPDFIIADTKSIQPAPANYLEDPHDKDFYYNACRVPWRLTVDYLFNNSNIVRNALYKINNWLIDNTNANPDLIYPGYTLDGSPIATDYQDVCFYGAFAVSAMATRNQAWLDSLFNKMVNDSPDNYGYYGNTLKLLYLLTLSGNIWEPR